MNFCEDCGAPLTPGVLFCENCGAKIRQEKELDSQASAPATVEEGIIYTNLPLLAEKLGKSQNEVESTIGKFVESAKSRGVGYTLLDCSQKVGGLGTVAEHVQIIRSEVEKNHQKYLFILGSDNVVPSIVWDNETGYDKDDVDVQSDLPYSTFDTNSPFEGQEYDFGECLCVGRLPNVDFENYFANLESCCGKINEIKTFGLSALVWNEETKDIYSEIKAGPAVLTSPEVLIDSVSAEIPSDTNMLLFNLHGHDKTEFWYGQEGDSYPEAVAPGSFDGIQTPYFLAVEACYGAAYSGRETSGSVLLSSLEGKCVSFLGSSRIAFGTPAPVGICADIICGEHLKNLKSGMSAGEALNKAREVLMEDDACETVKTLAEFALYGDPSARMQGTPKAAKGLFARNTTKSFSKGIRIPLPDVRRAVRWELFSADMKIAKSVEDFVYRKYSDLEGTKPKYYKSSKNEYKAVFEKNVQIGKKIVFADFSSSGKVGRLIESK